MNTKTSKYLLLSDDYKEIDGVKYYRIQYLTEFTAIDGTQITPGTLGGYINSYINLTQEGVAVVLGESTILSQYSRIDNPNSLVYITSATPDTVHYCMLVDALDNMEMLVKVENMEMVDLAVEHSVCNINIQAGESPNLLQKVNIINATNVNISGSNVRIKDTIIHDNVVLGDNIDFTIGNTILELSGNAHISNCTINLNGTIDNAVVIKDDVKVGLVQQVVTFNGSYLSLTGSTQVCSGQYTNAAFSEGEYGDCHLEKYVILDDDTFIVDIAGASETLYRVKYTKDFTAIDGTEITSGMLGGYIREPQNNGEDLALSQDGLCAVLGAGSYIAAKASVTGDALVSGNCHISGTTEISGSAIVKGSMQIAGDNIIKDNAVLSGYITVTETAQIYEDAQLFAKTAEDIIYVGGHSKLYGNVRVCTSQSFTDVDISTGNYGC